SRVELLKPENGAIMKSPIVFSWRGIAGVGGYRLFVKSADKTLLSAVLKSDTTSYTAPPWLKGETDKSLTWNVQALKADGSVLQASEPGVFRIK
ncbi:hypothetical protein IQ266_27405, partial [filamentous cyanobacterium LEGE 11480]|nr:hypothetical protein [Romeriopsis navalis LEGE 11480]